MKVAITGATGLIGRRLMAALARQGDEVVALARRPDAGLGVETRQWDPVARPAPVSGVDAVVHLAGEPVSQRWSEPAKERIRTSRTVGTANLVAGLEAADPKPAVLVSTSAAGYYGDRGRSCSRSPRRRDRSTTSWSRCAWSGNGPPSGRRRSACAW